MKIFVTLDLLGTNLTLTWGILQSQLRLPWFVPSMYMVLIGYLSATYRTLRGTYQTLTGYIPATYVPFISYYSSVPVSTCYVPNKEIIIW